MPMQALTCNSKIKLDATFAWDSFEPFVVPGTNDCNGRCYCHS